MTLEKLSRLYVLQKSIREMQDAVDQIRGQMDIHSPSFDGMPKASGFRDRTTDTVAKLIDTEAKLKERTMDFVTELAEINQFIAGIDDPVMSVIVHCRFVKMMSWVQVANEVGGGNTEDSVKKMFYRWLAKSESCPECHGGL